MGSFEPSFKATLEPHPEAYEPVSPLESPPPSPKIRVKDEDAFPEPVELPACCSATIPPLVNDSPYEPCALLQALGAAFAVGAAVGSLLAYAFSRRTILEVASEVA
jgi:hypothetical protein